MYAADFAIRTMPRDGIDVAVEWAAREGWNPGLGDADAFFAADPEGFLVGELDGEPVATISAVKYGRSFGFMGFYIVRPDCRGNGYGLRLWEAAMTRLAGRNIGLDGVVAQQANYARSGFRLAYRNIRYEGVSGGHFPQDANLVDLTLLPFDIIAAYDRPFFPDERESFLAAWLEQPGAHALGYMRGRTLAGIGVIRPCRRGYKIGPLFADDAELAGTLFDALAASVSPEDPLYLDVPEVNEEAVALAERHAMQPVFETARMYTGCFPELPTERLFGVTSFELG